MAAVGGRAQAQEPAPRVPAGVEVAVLPVQRVAPAPSGAWPGGAASRDEARGRMDAELDFALAASEATGGWPGPADLAEQVERNPTIDADPHRLAVGRLIDTDPEDAELRDPLHRQLRRLSALAGVRIAVIPLRLAWRPPEGTAGGGDTAAAGAGRSDTAGAGRAVLELAIVDTRAARVLWRGEVRGAPGPPDEAGTLATLAADLVQLLSP